MVKAAQSLHNITKCEISLAIQPTWKGGRPRGFTSNGFAPEEEEEEDVQPEPAPPAAEPEDVEVQEAVNNIPPRSQRRGHQ